MTTYELLFSIPQLDSAFMRNPAGGGRLKIDVPQESIAAVNAMIDQAVQRGGVVFAAAVVVVEDSETLTDFDDATTEESKREAPRMDIRRATKRRNQRAGG